MCIELYPHNQKTYEKIKEIWKNSDKCAAIQPTGTGKSFLIMKCCEDFKDKNKLILAPTRYILRQFEQHMQNKFHKYILMTYDKLAGLTESEIDSLNPSLIVFDEFHRCGADMWGKGVERLLNFAPMAKILGTSATPIRYLDNERDMSDELFDGQIACNMTLAEAIVDGILTMPIYVSALYDFQEDIDDLKIKIENSNENEENKTKLKIQLEDIRNNLKNSKGIPLILQKHLNEKRNGKFVVFCKNAEHVEEMKDIVRQWFQDANVGDGIHSYFVYSSLEDKDEQYRAFVADNSNNIRLLFAINMLNEGVHIDIDGAVFLRDTKSPIIYYQQIGRVTDAGVSEHRIIFDFVNNSRNACKNLILDEISQIINKRYSEDICSKKEKEYSVYVYDEVEEIIRILEPLVSKIEDNCWMLRYNELIVYMKENNDDVYIQGNRQLGLWLNRQRKRWRAFLGENFQYQIKPLSEKQIKLLEQIGISYTHPNELQWYKMFDKWLEDKNAPEMWWWTSRQRVHYINGTLPTNRKILLEENGFVFNIQEDRFNQGIEYFKEYMKNNISPPNSKVVLKNGFKLGVWYASMQNRFKSGSLSDVQIRTILKHGGDFNIRNKQIEQEKYKINLIDEWQKSNGKIIPVSLIYKGEQIGKFARNCRCIQQKRGLPKWKEDMLNQIGFVWNQNAYIWNEKYKQLKKYYDNSICLDTEIEKTDKSLVSWCSHQRSNYRKGVLTEQQVQKLERLNFIWDLGAYKKREIWEDRYTKMKVYIKTNKTSYVGRDNQQLSDWSRAQRKKYKEGSLDKDKREALLHIGFEF